MCVHAHSLKNQEIVFPSELFEDTTSLPEGLPALALPTPLRPNRPGGGGAAAAVEDDVSDGLGDDPMFVVGEDLSEDHGMGMDIDDGEL